MRERRDWQRFRILLRRAKGQPRSPGRARRQPEAAYMHHEIGVCSIDHNELSATLPLRDEREHATRPAARLWNGSKPSS
jgi:hypothetical protein